MRRPVSAVGGRFIVQLTYIVEESCCEMKKIVGVYAVCSCPPVECLDRFLKVKVSELVLLDDGRTNCGDVMYGGDAGVE